MDYGNIARVLFWCAVPLFWCTAIFLGSRAKNRGPSSFRRWAWWLACTVVFFLDLYAVESGYRVGIKTTVVLGAQAMFCLAVSCLAARTWLTRRAKSAQDA